MKCLSIVRVAVLALPLVLASCGSHKKAVQEPVKMTPEVKDKVQFLESVKDGKVHDVESEVLCRGRSAETHPDR